MKFVVIWVLTSWISKFRPNGDGPNIWLKWTENMPQTSTSSTLHMQSKRPILLLTSSINNTGYSVFPSRKAKTGRIIFLNSGSQGATESYLHGSWGQRMSSNPMTTLPGPIPCTGAVLCRASLWNAPGHQVSSGLPVRPYLCRLAFSSSERKLIFISLVWKGSALHHLHSFQTRPFHSL